MNHIEQYQEKAKQLRKDVLRMTTRAGIGHVTSSFSCTELMIALYYSGVMQFDPQNPGWGKRDYFILSKGHANPIFFCVLADLGFFPKEWLDTFCQPGGRLGVLLRDDVPGAEILSGSLGCGLGIAAGMAQSLRMDGKSNLVFCMVGDGECREGAIWEAAMHIGYQKLGNLIAIIDRNQLACTHFTEEEAGVEPLAEKWRAFGFDVVEINGHDFSQVLAVLNRSSLQGRKKPLAIIANTVKGKGVPFIENKPLMHGAAVKAEDLQRALDAVDGGLVL